MRRPANLALAAVWCVACAKADSGTPVDAADDVEVDAPVQVDAEECADVWYADVDGDQHGNPGARMIACAAPAGYVAAGDDCDDTQALAFPGGVEVCDGLDNDCMSATTEVCSSGCVVRVRPDDSRRYLFCVTAASFANAGARCTMEQFRLVETVMAPPHRQPAGCRPGSQICTSPRRPIAVGGMARR
ncbi:MAG TPA: putative metal-binding motif-containing protein [Kofleriaceae bacterium]|nr:putative metal-binding motif-containing protein [Kofleriaceae bacterium]